MNSKAELYTLREWAPLTEIIDCIPTRVQRGFLPSDLNLTCIDATADFLAIGSDAGIVFWYNRQTGAIQKLKAELTARITCVKIVDSVEFMVAAGSSTGQVSVFQIQKELPPDLELVAPCTRRKPIERYTIRDLHQSAVSCCEWSKNGMKLYSGDRQGIVVLTQFDYQTHLSKSCEILNEAYEIVQLSVHQSYLLVSTLYRSIVCQCNSTNGKWHITQIGKKDRKQLVDCGGIFLKSTATNSRNPLLICGRPGLRFWIADTEGNVERTLIFKEAVARSPTWQIPILNPKTKGFANYTRPTVQTSDTTQNFRNILLYDKGDAHIVTHDDATLFILNVEGLCVEAVARGFRKILDLCVCGNEIFVLEGERSLLRLAPVPEKPNKTAKVIFNPTMPPPVPQMGASICGTFESPEEYEPAEQAVISAEECFELPPIEHLDLNIPIELAVESPRFTQNRRLEIFNQISELDFDQSILHHSGIATHGAVRKKRKNVTRTTATSPGIVEIAQTADQNDVKTKTTKSTQMDASYYTSANLKTAFTQHLPELLSPMTLERTIEEKTKKLADNLALPQVCLAPITDEELRESKALAEAPYLTPPAPAAIPQTTETPAASTLSASKAKLNLMQLTQAYPSTIQVTKQTQQVEDAGVQTTPRKRNYYLEEYGEDEQQQQPTLNYLAGEPIDNICIAPAPTPTSHNTAANNLNFVRTQPSVNNVIESFLLDFGRAGDPLRKSPPPSGESNTSSEWEFLDN